MKAAQCTIPVRDVWPAAKLNCVIQRAYYAANLQGHINIQFPIVAAKDKIVFDYLSSIPEDWIRQAIRKMADGIRDSLEAERQSLLGKTAELLQGLEAAGEDALPAFIAVQDRLSAIYSILST